MNRWLYRFVLIVLFYVCSSGLCLAQVNLLQNGSFERQAISGVPDFWTRAYASAGGSSSRSTNMVQYGDYGLKLVDGATNGSEGVLSDAIPVAPGVSYTAEAYIYRTNGNHSAALYLRYYNATNGLITNVSVPVTTTNAWGYVTISSRAPIDAEYAKLICYSAGISKGTIYFDAASFFRSKTQSMVDNPTMDLDAVGSYPVNWTNYYGTGEPVSVGTDASKGHIMVLTDTSATQPAAPVTRIPVIGNMTYAASAEMFRVSGGSPSLTLMYRDQTNGLVGSTNVVDTTLGVWTTNTVTMKAPENAVEAQILAYTGFSVTGTAYFANFTFAPVGVVNRYVSTAALGTGTGSSSANAAKYNDATFWSGVQALLSNQSVVVDFRYGDYAINATTTHKLDLTNIGTTNNVLILQGRNPYGSVFTRTASADAVAYKVMVEFSNAKNIVLRHLHWEDNSPLGKTNGYGLVFNTDTNFPNAEAENIIIEGCSFVGMTNSYYGAMGFHDVYNGKLRNCEFVHGGLNSHFHFSYNTRACGSRFEQNYLENCTGPYLRLRDNSHENTVAANEFVSTVTNFNRHFVEMAVFNDINPGNEVLGYNITITDNIFTYTSALGIENVAIHFNHSGFDPMDEYGYIWPYLLTTSEGTTMASGTTTAKKSLILTHYGLDFDSEVTISGNTRTGLHSYNMQFSTFAAYGAVNKGGDGDYNISALDGN